MPAPIQLDRLHVVLVAARNPLNIGAAARAMSNFGFRSLRVVNPYEPSFREARSAVGASEILEKAEFFHSVADAVADCTLVVGTTAVRNRELQHPVHRPEYAARLIRKRARAGLHLEPGGKKTGGVALLFGSEKFGLSNEDLSHCHWLIRIPTCDENISMNLGQAVAVCLYELIRDSKCERAPGQPAPATSKELERITALLLEALHTSGFLDRRRVNDSEDRIRRLVRRLHLQERDAVIWLGMLRQMLWKMNAGKDSGSGEVSLRSAAGGEKRLQQLHGLPGQNPRSNFDAMIQGRSVEHLQARANGAALGIVGAVNQPRDARLHQRARAHGAGFDGHVQRGAVEAMISGLQGGFAQGHHFGVRRGIAIGNGAIAGRRDNPVLDHDQRADRHFAAQGRGSRLIQRQMHVFGVGHVCGVCVGGIRYSTSMTSCKPSSRRACAA